MARAFAFVAAAFPPQSGVPAQRAGKAGAFAQVPGATPSILLFLFPAVLFSVLLAGCAAPGEPYERKPPTPMAITDLTAVQEGNDVVLTFTLPQQAADRRPLQEVPAIEIYRDFATPPAPPAPAKPTLLVTIPGAMVDRYAEQGHIRYTDSLGARDFAQHPGSVVIYTIRTHISEKKPSEISNAPSVRLLPAFDAVADLKTQVTHDAVVLTWTPPAATLAVSAPPIAGYRIYRGISDASSTSPSPGEDTKPKSPLVKIADAAAPPFQDTQFEFGANYIYSVRSVAQYPEATIESSDSNLAAVSPRDTFPPAAPQGLLVVLVPAQPGAAAHLELSWAISPETDIAGYNVYRGDQTDTPGSRQNADLLPTPAFRDMNVQPGHRYFYTVTAVDRAGNESPASAAVSSGVPAESQATQ